MKLQNTPATDVRYWVALVAASVFGANMGDLCAHVLGLGHVGGLAPLAVIFSVIMIAERRAPTITEAFYWLAIVTVRTAATNLSDLGAHDVRIPYLLFIGGLLAVLAVVVAIEMKRHATTGNPGDVRQMPATDGLYWTAMLVAGTVGTAGGDYIADLISLSSSTVLTIVVLALLLAARFGARLAGRPFYWICIVGVRMAGTNIGDFLASDDGINLGLLLSTTLSGLTLVSIVALWRRQAVIGLSEAQPGV